MIKCNNSLINSIFDKTLYSIHFLSQPFIYYLFVFLVFSILVLILIYRFQIRTGFWGKQPMKHKYSLLDKMKGEGVIEGKLPVWNKYCNEVNVNTTDQINETTLSRIAELSSKNESLDDGLVKHINTNDLEAMFNGFLNPVYVSFYNKASSDYGCLTSRPIKIRIKDVELQAYYFDLFHIASSSGSNKENIESNLLQTHEFYQRSNNPDISVSLFFRKKRLNQVSELCAFDIVTYEIDLDLDYDFSCKRSIHVFSVKTSAQISTLIDFVKSRKNYFKIDFVTTIGNLLTLIEKGQLFVIGCTMFDQILGYVFFRDFKNGTKHDPVLDCICSLFDKEIDSTLYLAACQSAFSRGIMIATKTCTFRYLRIWALGDCKAIINLLVTSKRYIKKEAHYLYLYNYRSNIVEGERILMLI